jgi:hypothetical protein
MRRFSRWCFVIVLCCPALTAAVSAQAAALDHPPTRPASIIAPDSGEARPGGLRRAVAARLHRLTEPLPVETSEKADARLARRKNTTDSTADGLVIGALVGAGTMAGVTAMMYARCDAGCEAPAEGPMFLASMGFGAGVGAAAGWIIDKLK